MGDFERLVDSIKYERKKRMIRKFLRYIYIFVICSIMIFPTNFIAAEANDENVEIEYSSDKNIYDLDDEIKTVLKIKNNNDYVLTNFTVNMDLPVGYVLKEIEKIPKNEKIAAHSSKSYNITLVREDIESSTDEDSPILSIVILIVLVLAVIIALWFINNRRKRKNIITGVLIFSSIVGTIGAPLSFNAAQITRGRTDVTLEVEIDGKKQNIIAMIQCEYNVDSELIGIDTEAYGYSEEENAYKLTKKEESISGWLKSPQKYERIDLQVYDDKGNLIVKKSIEPAEKWKFDGVGLHPCKNQIKVEAIGKKNVSVEIDLVDIFGFNYFLFDNAEIDTDGDGLYDRLEDYLGTDRFQVDTDGDLLTDYQECIDLSTNPLVIDTDGNGVSDFDEDADGDGISNGIEYQNGTLPNYVDSDFDGLDDKAELYQYNTSPVKIDSDEDGATDYWEVINGYNPYGKDEVFVVKEETSSVSEYKPVGLDVEVVLKDNQADIESLKIEKVYTYDNPYISPSIVGYLGDIYEITMDGEFESAKLSFKYDESLGNLSKEFQPRIYYFNEESKIFEELENQTVQEGVITATTSHFSIYALLNKAERELKWEESRQIAKSSKPYMDANIVFLMDNSASMAYENSLDLSIESATYFIDMMRDGYDKALIMTYTKETNIVCNPTENKNTLKKVMNTLAYDNGLNSLSGTDSYNALKKAISSLTDEDNNYIILVTDGDDNYSCSSYAEVEQMAHERGIQIYVVGVGTDSLGDLATLAASTGGESIVLASSSEIQTKLQEIASDMMAKNTDTNKDGISDYYTEMICNGMIVTTTGAYDLKGRDLSDCLSYGNVADYDGDGLLNGEEIEVVHDGEKLVIKINSNPVKTDSDFDGLSDSDERAQGTNPMQKNIAVQNVNYLLDDSKYIYEKKYRNFDSSLFDRGITWINGSVFGAEDKNDMYREAMLEYYANYAVVENLKDQIQKETILDVLSDIVQGLDNSTQSDVIKILKDIDEISDKLNRGTFKEFCDTYGKEFTELLKTVEGNNSIIVKLKFGEHLKKLINDPALKDIIKFTDNYKDALGIIDVVMINASDWYETMDKIGVIESNSELLKSHEEVLNYMIANSTDYCARNASRLIKFELQKEYLMRYKELISEVIETSGEISAVLAMGWIVKNCRVEAVIALLLIEITGTMIGVEDDVEQLYQMLSYHELGTAYKGVMQDELNNKKEGQYIIEDDSWNNLKLELSNLAQIRILGEKKYLEYIKSDGIIISELLDMKKDFSSIKEMVLESENEVWENIKCLNLKVSAKVENREFGGNGSGGGGGGGGHIDGSEENKNEENANGAGGGGGGHGDGRH